MKSKQEGTSLNGFLDRGSRFEGELAFEETFRIDGRFEVLGDSAEVIGEVEVGRLSVNGSLKGTVRAHERVELHSKARVEADLTTPVLKIEEGARFEGSCRMTDRQPANVLDLQLSRK